MKPAGQPPRRATPTSTSWPLRGVAGLAVVVGAAVWIGGSLYRTAPGDTATPAAVPTATPAGPGLPVVAVPDALPPGAELPANLPPGIALVGTAPSAQPPLATLLLDGRAEGLRLQPAVQQRHARPAGRPAAVQPARDLGRRRRTPDGRSTRPARQ
jgi:hypothetical protein